MPDNRERAEALLIECADTLQRTCNLRVAAEPIITALNQAEARGRARAGEDAATKADAIRAEAERVRKGEA